MGIMPLVDVKIKSFRHFLCSFFPLSPTLCRLFASSSEQFLSKDPFSTLFSLFFPHSFSKSIFLCISANFVILPCFIFVIFLIMFCQLVLWQIPFFFTVFCGFSSQRSFWVTNPSYTYQNRPQKIPAAGLSILCSFIYLLQYGSFSRATTFVTHCARTFYPPSFSSHLFSFPPHPHRYCSGCFVSWEARNRLISSPHFSHRKMYR